MTRLVGSFRDPFKFGIFVILILCVLSIFEMEGSGRSLNFSQNLLRFLGEFFPPDWSVAPELLLSLRETFAIAILATCISFVIALPLSLIASRDLSSRLISQSFRFVLNFIRSIPSLIWALIAVAIFGASEVAGLVALSFYSLGYLGKFFSDDFDSIEKKNFDALRYNGSNLVFSFRYGLWPQLKPLLSSHFLWMLEYNVRAAAIIGYVGAGGIGTQLYIYQEFYQWNRFATALIFILIVVTLLDLIGQRLRSHLKS